MPSGVCSQACANGWDWAGNGYPCPTIEGYSYSVDAGLLRTRLDEGYYRQRRRYLQEPHRFTLRWLVGPRVLQSLLEAIHQYGYGGVCMPLVTAANGSPEPQRHLVRMISNVDVSAMSRSLFEVRVEAEMQDAGEDTAHG